MPILRRSDQRPLARRRLPPWLNVAVAYGARRSAGADAEGPLDQSAVYLGLDFEPTGLPLGGPFWNTVLPLLRPVPPRPRPPPHARRRVRPLRVLT